MGAIGALGWATQAAEMPSFDFTKPEGATGWTPTHAVSALEAGAEGLRILIAGEDPYITGPARDYPDDTPLWLEARLWSDAGGTAQVFYFRDAPAEEHSVHLRVAPGRWEEVRVPLPTLGSGIRFRFDPPGASGRCVLARLRVAARSTVRKPDWPKPAVPVLDDMALRLEAGSLTLRQAPDRLGQFALDIAGVRFAVGCPEALIGYEHAGAVRWVPGSTAAGSQTERRGRRLVARRRFADPDGGGWEIRQSFHASENERLEVEVEVSVDTDRRVVWLPAFLLLPGVGTFGTNKTQALLAGVEYLENEPSSSEADLRGPAARRLMPEHHKLTMPLAALAAAGRYLGLIWEPRSDLGVVFDSPDRQFGSGGHLLGLVFPGSTGSNRDAGSLLPDEGEWLRAGSPLRFRVTLIGGPGNSVVPAIRESLRLRGLPPLPEPEVSATEFYRLAAHGWLDSRIREGNQYRHAFWPGFGPAPAADAALWMDWLALHVADENLATRLQSAAQGAREAVPPPRYDSAAVGHIRSPAPALVYGALPDTIEVMLNRGRALAQQFRGDGVIVYEAPRGGTDYGSTHWAREANGLAANVVAQLLECAAFTGNRELLEAGLRHLRGLDKFRGSVPRGAQTWEIPLHTPDILAAAHLVRAFTLGYELTGEVALLEEAKDWAWTGVPFVYLTRPVAGTVGLYNTIAVLGATGWQAPVWIGLPVQWCGLVYGESLYRLDRHDPRGPWRQLADGIALAGVQHTWPSDDTDRQGLLPDSFVLQAQLRDGPAINPATVLSQARRCLAGKEVYDFRVALRHGLRVHAAGELRDFQETLGGFRCQMRGWHEPGSWMLINGLEREPQVRINGAPIALEAPHEYLSESGILLLRVPGTEVTIEVETR